MRSLLLALALSIGVVSAQDKPASPLAIPASDDGLPGTGPIRRYDWFKSLWLEKRSAWAKRSTEDKGAVVFLGDSITQGWDGAGKAAWKTWADYKPANFGIGGDRTEHILWRLDHGNFDGLKPKLVVLMIGTNNTGHRKAEEPAADTAAGVKAILDKLHTKLPDTKVLLLGIFPRGEKSTDKLRVHNAAINDLLKPLADGKSITFMDIGSSFLQPDGTLSKDIMPDLLHLSPKGYELWASAIKDKVADLMK